MKLNCNIADDLLPLYLEDICSEDSRAALEEHLQECAACREKLARMRDGSVISPAQKGEAELRITDYAKKVKRRRLRAGILAALVCVCSACALSLCLLTVKDMHSQANPVIHDIESGVYDLTADKLETTAEDVEQYVFYTNTTQIAVSIQNDENFSGSVMLWNAADSRDWIMTAKIEDGSASCVFENLSAAQRYQITCGGLDGAAVTVSDNRTVSFWHSLNHVVKSILGQ